MSLTGNERGTVFTGRERISGELIGVIVVSEKNRKPLMILCIPEALEIQLYFYALNTLIAGVSC